MTGRREVLVFALTGLLGGLYSHHQLPLHPFALLDLVTQHHVGVLQLFGALLHTAFQIRVELAQLFSRLVALGDIGDKGLHHFRTEVWPPQQRDCHLHWRIVRASEPGFPCTEAAVVQQLLPDGIKLTRTAE